MDRPVEGVGGPDLAQDAEARLLQVVAALVAELRPEQRQRIRSTSHLERDLGLDSLARVELLSRIQDEFGVSIPGSALSEAETPSDLLRFMARAQASDRPENSSRNLRPSPPAVACDIPEQATTLIEALEWHAEHNPKRTHVLLYDENGQVETITYARLLRSSLRIASGLLAHGLVARQTVAMMLPTGQSYLASFFGVMLAGGIPVPIYPPVRLSQLEDHLKRHARILANAQTVFIITVAQAKGIAALLRGGAPSLREILTPDELESETVTPIYRCRTDDIAFLQYTSGSTGDPKGVILSHANLLANLRAIGKVTEVTSRDIFVSWLPLYHDMGLIGAWFGSLYFGMTLVLMPPLAFLTKPSRWLAAISAHRGTISAAPNFAYELCARKVTDVESHGLDLSCWRLAMNGAEPVSPKTLESFAIRFAPHGLRRETLFPVYGLAENSVGLTFPPLGRAPLIDAIQREAFAEERRALPASGEIDPMLVPSCGRVLPGHEVRIVDVSGEELQDRWIGRLQFRGPSATVGYFRNPEATDRLVCDGWLDSGDCAYSVAGEIYLTGRVKDLIIRAGRNIYPYELEQAVGSLPGLRKGCVAAFASNDPVNGTERLIVVAETLEKQKGRREVLYRTINDVVMDTIGLPADDIVLAPPHSVLKTSSGKIRRAASRDAYERGKLGGKAEPGWQQWLKVGAASLMVRLSEASSRTARVAYGSWFWIAFLLFVAPAAVLVALLQNPPIGHRLAHRMSRLFLALIGMPVHVTGLDKLGKPARLLLVNHSSYLDGLALCAALPPAAEFSFIAKGELTAKPLARAILQGLGAIFVERFSADKGAVGVEIIASALNSGRNLIIFPEGTFTRETGMRGFYMGAFLAAAEVGIPVLIAGLRGTRMALRDESWLPNKAKLEFEIGSLLDARGKDWRAAIDLRDQARVEMLKLCGEHDLLR